MLQSANRLQANERIRQSNVVLEDTVTEKNVAPQTILDHKGQLVTVRAGEVLAIPNANAFLGILDAGTLDVFAENRSRRLLFNTLQPGDIFPAMLYGGNTQGFLHGTMQSSKVRFLDRATLGRMLETRPELALDIFGTLRLQLARLDERMEEMVSYSLPIRSARLIIRLTLAHRQIIATGLTQERMANWLGINRESLTQALKAIRAQGIILARRKYLEVLEPAALCDLADAGTGEWTNGRLPASEPLIIERMLSHTRQGYHNGY